MKKSRNFLTHISVGLSIGVLAVTSVFPVSASYSTDREYLDALSWMHSAGMTKYKSSDEYMPGGNLLREQAAKFFVEYATMQDIQSSGTHTCLFSDMAQADHTLKSYIVEACELGIIKGSQGKFLPKQVMTKAQALTVLVRIEAGLQDETGSPWWRTNFAKAQELQLTKERDVRAVDSPVSRYEIALLLARASGATKAVQGDPELEETYRLVNMLSQYLRTE